MMCNQCTKLDGKSTKLGVKNFILHICDSCKAKNRKEYIIMMNRVRRRLRGENVN